MEFATTFDELVAFINSKNTSRPVLLGIDGFDGSGKTTLAFAVANRLSGVRVGLDDYVDEDRKADSFVGLLRLEDLARDLSRLLRRFRLVVVDGVCLSQAFAAIGTKPSSVIYVKKISQQGLWHDGFHLEDYLAGTPAGSWLEQSVYAYHQQYQPHIRAPLCYSWTKP